MTSTPKIAIIGAGPAGLTLARLLLVSETKVDLTIYELAASAAAREGQGGTLDLHTGTGLAAIRKCNLWDSFSKYARYDGQEMILADKNATILVHMGDGKTEGDRPEIDREKLQEILLESVPKEIIRWGRKLKEITQDGKLRFDGVEQLEGPYDLIVGADGAWSKARERLHGQKPAYAGVSGYEMEIPEPAKQCPELNEFIGRGGFFGSSDQKLLNAQRMGNDSLKVRSWFQCPEGEAAERLERLGQKDTLAEVKTWYTEWAPEITELLRQANPESIRHWTLYELPVGCKWEHVKGCTLIGDAASLATPFSGEGVNKAMTDALQLAELIEKSQDTSNNLALDQAVLQYEEKMFPRAEKIQSLTEANKTAMFRADAPVGLISRMLETMALDDPSVLAKLISTTPVVATVYSYFWIRTQIGWAVRKYWRRT
jgi:2-polyprenyl-6-methoxyphenol hydroxylase-like FAD-dependent oxidoreductase